MQINYPSKWIVTAYRAFARLAENPWALFVLLAAIHSINKPYDGIWHDARLYSGQVLNQVEQGSYSDDLFFRYGSQDNYSLFSRMAAPLVKWVGLETAFFLIFIFSKTILILGMIRLVQTLIPNRVAGVLALCYCMAVLIRYGGHSVLNVQEGFLTPRTLACGVVLLGLDFMLRGRPVVSLAMVLLAASVHPLMAFAGLLIWFGYQIWTYAGGWAFVSASIGAGTLAAIPIFIEPIGKRCFGEMDDVWRDAIQHASGFNFPSQWTTGDWFYLAIQLALAVLMIAKAWRTDAARARFLVVLSCVTVVGAVGAVVAEQLPYALPLQGQPYRALWILAVLHYAFAFALIVEYSHSRSVILRAIGCVLLGYVCRIDMLNVELMFPLFAFPFFVLSLRGLDASPRDRNWLIHSIQLSLIAGGVMWSGYKLLLLAGGVEMLIRQHSELQSVVAVFLMRVGPIVPLIAGAVIVTRYYARIQIRPGRIALAGLCIVAFQSVFFVIPRTDLYTEHCTRYRGDLHRLRAIIHESRKVGDPLPTVYCDIPNLDYVWLELRSKCYFEWWQAGGYMFRREMAMEGRRRSKLVAPFAVEHIRNSPFKILEEDKVAISRMFQVEFDKVWADRDSLARLCREPGLDYIVATHCFDGLFETKVGELYLYKCSNVRLALGLTIQESAPVVAVNR